MSAGIDYGNSLTNIDHETGIRFGVIHSHEVLQAWCDSAESDYGEPHCPDCGNDAIGVDDATGPDEANEWFVGRDYFCRDCETCFWSDSAFGDEPLSHNYSDEEYEASQGGDDCDIFVTRSPFYTYAPFCSPCAPGAGYLGSALPSATAGHDLDDLRPTGVKTYCFGHDWFDDGKAPYRVFRVSDDVEVFSE